MRVGIHLPQYGRVAGPDAIRTSAQRAEQFGFADVWISDHIVHPAEQSYPSPYLYDPLATLAFAAAVTDEIGLGTSVLVLPQHNPLELANVLASTDALSRGRVTLGIGVGWSQREFEALGYDFENRGARTDEILAILRACWREDPASFAGEHYSFENIRVVPKPAHDIPIWCGGTSARALRRGIELCDGHQIIGVKPDEAAPLVARLRAARPEPEFTISLRTGWDPQGMDPAEICDEYAAFAEVGIQHVVSAPWRSTLDEWLRSMELLAEIAELEPR
jgi:probable F420-dependent oxidoreductase